MCHVLKEQSGWGIGSARGTAKAAEEMTLKLGLEAKGRNPYYSMSRGREA